MLLGTSRDGCAGNSEVRGGGGVMSFNIAMQLKLISEMMLAVAEKTLEIYETSACSYL